MSEEHNHEYEISLVDLFKIVMHKWYVVTIVTVLFMVVTGVAAYTQLENKYTARASMIIQDLNYDQTDYQAIQTGQKLVDTYHEIAISDRVLEQVISAYDLDYTADQIRDMITMTSTNDTIVIELEVESYNAADSATIANGMVVVIRDVTLQFEGLETVEQLDIAKVPSKPSGPNRPLYIIIGGILAGGVSVVGVLMFEFLDKKLKSPNDLEKYLGIRVLGTIPYYELEDDE